MHHFDQLISLLPAHGTMTGGNILLLFDGIGLLAAPGRAKLLLELVEQRRNMIVELRQGKMRRLRQFAVFRHFRTPAIEDSLAPCPDAFG